MPSAAVVDGVDGGDPEAGGQHPVEGGGGTAPLDMAEDGGPGLETGALLDLCGQPGTDATQADVAELVDLARGHGERPFLGRGPFSYHDDGGVVAAHSARLQRCAYHVHVEGLLRDEDVGRAPGDPGINARSTRRGGP